MDLSSSCTGQKIWWTPHSAFAFVTFNLSCLHTDPGWPTVAPCPAAPALTGYQMCRNEQVLVNTCVRCARLQLDLDISKCSTWIHFLDVHYQRPPTGSEDMETEEVRLRRLR